jgi:flavin-dependent dehydrogenase
VTDQSCDVAVVGGGPGGCAAALSLRVHAPGLSVVVVEASGYEGPRIGETLPPPAAGLLSHLGVWHAFVEQGHREVYGTAALWGGPAPHENDFMLTIRGAGWHLDRRAFDAMLAAEAERRGARVERGTRVERAMRVEGVIRLLLSSGQALSARVVLDATGAKAMVARQLGARWVALDKLAGFARFFREVERSDPRTLVEAFADGWWYTAALPDGRRVAACMTDTDIARRLRLGEEAEWRRLLDATARVRELVGEARPEGGMVVRAARSRRLSPAAGEGWLAVGDAASTFDPLSSQGIAKALRSGIFASYATADLLVRDDPAALARYDRFTQREYDGYVGARSTYYAAERRWPDRPFWQRRQGEPTWQGSSI